MHKRGNEITDAVEQIEAVCGPNAASQIETWLSTAQMWPNSAAFFHSLATAPDKDALLDHLAALRYGLIFRSLGFLPSFEPTGGQGPDLLVARDGICATVEVTRFRGMNPGPAALTEEAYLEGEWLLEAYGNPQRDVAKCIRKVKDKFRQAIAPHAIIAVWNDDEALEEVEMRTALRDLQHDPGLPAGLDLVVYGSQCIGRFQLYSFPMKLQLDSLIREWAHQIESVIVSAAINTALAMDGGAQSSQGVHPTS